MKISSITNMNEVRLRLSSSNSGIKFLDSSEEFSLKCIYNQMLNILKIIYLIVPL